MTQAKSEDTGYPFLVVRMLLPPSTELEKLTPDIRKLVEANIERAGRIFRSRTLPWPGSDTRFLESLLDVGKLSSELESAILEGINDKTALDILALPPLDEIEKPNLRIEVVQTGSGKNRRFEFQTAGALLGKYWYRHQEMDILDAVQMARHLEDAQDRGESMVDIINRSKPPAPPRRIK